MHAKLVLLALPMALVVVGCAMTPGTASMAAQPASKAALEARMLEVLDYVETAEETATGLDGEALQAARAMRSRNAEIRILLYEGTLAQTNRGYLRLWDASQRLEASRRNSMQQLLAQENRDRKTLFRELARMQEPARVSVAEMETLWALLYAKRAEPGTHVQLPPAGPGFARFLASDAGRRVGDAPEPEAWVSLQ